MEHLPTRKIFLTALLIHLLYLWPVPAPMTCRYLYFARSVSEGHLDLDAYGTRTGDRVQVAGHFYPSTPPLLAVASAPILLGLEACHVIASKPGLWSVHDEVLALLP